MIIYVDCDGVLNNLVPKTLDIYNAHTGKNIQMSDITTYNLNECLSEEDAKNIYELWSKEILWDSLEPLPDAQWGIETLLNTGHKVAIATATYYEQFDWKLSWMKQHFPTIDTKHIIRINDKSLLRGDVLIDDNIDNLANSCCERICLSYPYNQDKDKDWVYEIYRARNWKEIIKTIQNIERKMKEWEKM
jgi:5'(3')-deoxyribonucleotidase